MVENKKVENPDKTDNTTPKSASSNDAKIKAALSCIPIVGLIMYFVEKEDQRVRFYAAQGILIGILSIVVEIIPIVNFFAWIFILVLIIVVALKAYQTEEKYKLPVIGDWAEEWAAKKM